MSELIKSILRTEHLATDLSTITSLSVFFENAFLEIVTLRFVRSNLYFRRSLRRPFRFLPHRSVGDGVSLLSLRSLISVSTLHRARSSYLLFPRDRFFSSLTFPNVTLKVLLETFRVLSQL